MEKILTKGIVSFDKFSPEFIEAFETFIPTWLESLIPHYNVAKKYGADILALQNESHMGEPPESLVVGDVHYYLKDNEYFGKILDFAADYQYYDCNWKTEFKKVHTSCEDIDSDKMWSDFYTVRYIAKKPPYNELRLRIEEKFKQMVGDENIIFDFGSTSYIILNPEKKHYIETCCKFEA